MGPARAGSTLLGTLLGQDPGVFYAGELAEWPARDGKSSSVRSQDFWQRIRSAVGEIPPSGPRLRLVMEHPQGMRFIRERRRLAGDYRYLTVGVVDAVAETSGRPTVVDSSHLPLRARALVKLLPAGRVVLVYMVRRPSAIAQSFRSSGAKNELQIQLYLLAVGLMAWWAYLLHPRQARLLVAHESLVRRPSEVAAQILGHSIAGLDVARMEVPPVLIANRFSKGSAHVAIVSQPSTPPGWRDRLTDAVQLPLHLAWWLASRRLRSG